MYTLHSVSTPKRRIKINRLKHPLINLSPPLFPVKTKNKTLVSFVDNFHDIISYSFFYSNFIVVNKIAFTMFFNQNIPIPIKQIFHIFHTIIGTQIYF